MPGDARVSDAASDGGGGARVDAAASDARTVPEAGPDAALPCVPVPETCDGRDENCDGAIDEALTEECYTGPAGTVGVGACLAGRSVCVAGAWLPCQGQVLPGVEICDQIDNDCNAATDDVDGGPGACLCLPGERRACYGGPPETLDVGACRAGLQDCSPDGRSWGPCAEQVLPEDETCDGTDEDCDGDTDESADVPGAGVVCLAGVGACATPGETVCDGERAELVCGAVPGLPVAEVCDGVDNDCDGLADDGLAGCCMPGEIRPCGAVEGACEPGVSMCGVDRAFGLCVGDIGPTDERCNALDDDCDGAIDEGLGLGAACETGLGACRAEGTLVCDAGERVVCSAVPGQPSPEACDGIDNDCDGAVDGMALLGEPCAVGVGACARFAVQTCVDGVFRCPAVAGAPSREICNGVDDDCNTKTDENHLPGGQCTAGLGACRSVGRIVCTPEGGSICDAVPREPEPEVCDGRDNDCDGQTDEATAPGLGDACEVEAAGCRRQGVLACAADGAVFCDAESSAIGDRDADGVDCGDLCPDNAEKRAPGVCGCDYHDVDADGDGVVTCVLATGWEATGDLHIAGTDPDTGTLRVFGTDETFAFQPITGPGVFFEPDGSMRSAGPTFAGSGSEVGTCSTRTAASDGQGGWYVAGTFSHAGGRPRRTLAHVLADGRVDPHFFRDRRLIGRAVELVFDAPRNRVFVEVSPVVDRLVTQPVVVGPYTGRGARLSAATGEVLPGLGAGRIPAGSVSAALNDGLGGWYVAGSFEHAGGYARHGLVHLLPDGSVDPSLDVAVDGTVRSMAVAEGVLYLGGDFSAVGGQARARLAAVDRATGVVSDWNPGADARVDALAVDPDSLFVGGSFATIGNEARRGVAAFDRASGRLRAWSAALDGAVTDLAVSGSALYLAGPFAAVGGELRSGLAAVESSTGAVLPWNPSPDSSVTALALSDDAVYVAGSFSVIGGAPRGGLAALDPATALARGWTPPVEGVVTSLGVAGGRVFVGQTARREPGRLTESLTAFDEASADRAVWSTALDADIVALAATPDELFVGGHFDGVGGDAGRFWYALDGRTGAVVDTALPLQDVTHMLLVGGRLIVTGGFQHIAGEPRNGLAALDLATGALMPWDPAPDGPVTALAAADGVVYIGGAFTNLGPTPRAGLGAVDLATGAVTAWAPPAIEGRDARIRSLAVDEARVLVGGEFTSIGGLRRTSVGAFDRASGRVTPFAPELRDTVGPRVDSVVVVRDAVYIDGRFETVNGFARRDVAAVETATGRVLPWNPWPENETYNGETSSRTSGSNFVVADERGGLFVGGYFDRAGGLVGPQFFDLDPITGRPTPPVRPWPATDGVVHLIEPDGTGGWYVSGAFTEIGGLPRAGLARLRPDLTVDPDWFEDVGIMSFFNHVIGGPSALLPVAERGEVLVGGSFRSVGQWYGAGIELDATGRPSHGPGLGRITGGAVSAVVPDGRGGWYVGGSFQKIDGATHPRLAHIQADGTLDADWQPAPDERVEALHLEGGLLYVAGMFESMGSEDRFGLAAVDADSGRVLPWRADVSGTVRTLAVGDGRLFIGGTFDTVNGEPRANLAGLDLATGTVTALRADAEARGFVSVNALAYADGILYVGGDFSTVGGIERNNAAAVDADTGVVLPWDPQVNRSVYDLAIQGESVFLAGWFNTIGASRRELMAEVDAMTGLATAWEPALFGNDVVDLVIEGNTLYFAGSFRTDAGPAREQLAAVDLDTRQILPALAEASLDGDVDVVAVSGDRVYVGAYAWPGGGQGFLVDPVVRGGFAALDLTTGQTRDWSPVFERQFSSGYLNRFERVGDSLFVGGSFTEADGEPRNGLAAFDLLTGQVMPWNLDVDEAILTHAIGDGTLFIGGRFSRVNGARRDGVAAVDVATAAIQPWDARISTSNDVGIRDLEVDGDRVFVSGGFGQVGGMWRMRVAAVERSTGAILPWDPDLALIGMDRSPGVTAFRGRAVLTGTLESSRGHPRYHMLVTCSTAPCAP